MKSSFYRLFLRLRILFVVLFHYFRVMTCLFWCNAGVLQSVHCTALYLSRGWMDFNAGSTKNFSLCKSLPGFTTSGVGKYPLILISKILNFLLFLLKIEASSPKWLLSVTDEHNHISSSLSTQECSTVNLQAFHTLSKSKTPRSFSNLAAPKKSTMVNHRGLLLASAVLTYSSAYAQQVREKENT